MRTRYHHHIITLDQRKYSDLVAVANVHFRIPVYIWTIICLWRTEPLSHNQDYWSHCVLDLKNAVSKSHVASFSFFHVWFRASITLWQVSMVCLVAGTLRNQWPYFIILDYISLCTLPLYSNFQKCLRSPETALFS